MENQHRKIKCYRELSQTEIDLMNEVKAKGVELGELVTKIQTYLREQSMLAQAYTADCSERVDQEEFDRVVAAEGHRWSNIAKTDLQTGLMALTRSIAQPGFF